MMKKEKTKIKSGGDSYEKNRLQLNNGVSRKMSGPQSPVL